MLDRVTVPKVLGEGNDTPNPAEIVGLGRRQAVDFVKCRLQALRVTVSRGHVFFGIQRRIIHLVHRDEVAAGLATQHVAAVTLAFGKLKAYFAQRGLVVMKGRLEIGRAAEAHHGHGVVIAWPGPSHHRATSQPSDLPH